MKTTLTYWKKGLSHIRGVLLISLLLSSGPLIFSTLSAQNQPPPPDEIKRILMLASYHQSHDWTQRLVDAIISGAEKFPQKVSFDIDDYDTLLTPDPALHEQTWLRYLKKLQAGQYDMLVLLDNPAVDLALKYEKELPPELPVVFAGYEYCPADFKKKHPWLTGVAQCSNPDGTLDLAMKLFPDTGTILILSDSSKQSLDFEERFKETDPVVHGIRPIFWNTAENRPRELFHKIAALPENTVILLSPWRGLYNIDYQSLETFSSDLRRFCKRPFFVSGLTMIGYGALGGYGTDPARHGHEAATLIQQVLQKGNSREFPIIQGTLLPYFDYPAMKENHLDFSRLPHNAVLLNKPQSILWEYRYYWGSVFLLLLFILGGCALALIIIRKNLKRSRALYTILPGRVGVMNREEKLLFLKTESLSDFDTSKMKYLRDIPGIDYQTISDAVGEVFRTGIPRTLEYEFRAASRMISMAPAPHNLFGEDAIVWLSHDNSELQNARKQAADLLRHADIERQLLINNINMPVWLFNAEGGMIRCNQFVQKMVGLPMEEIIRKPCHELFQCQRHEKNDCILLQTIRDRKPHQIATHFGGRKFIIDARPVLDENGKLLNIVESGMDVTELNEIIDDSKVINDCMEVLLSELDMNISIVRVLKMICSHVSANRSYIMKFDTDRKRISCYREYFESGAEPLFSDIQDQPYSCSPNWETRFAKNEYIMLPDVVRDGEKEGLGLSWLNTLSQKKICSVYCHRLILDGKFWGYFGMVYEKKKHQLTDRNFHFIRSAAHLFEIMIRRQELQAQLVDALKQAQAAEKAKSYFIASISHEIRTPLNAIIGFAELLHRTVLPPEEQKDYLDGIAYSGDALLQLINDVLDLSKLEADQMKIIPAPTDFDALGHEVMQVFKFRAEEKNLELRFNIKPLPIMDLDKLRLRQILFNLIGNAVKFTPSGSITLNAEFTPAPDGYGDFSFSVTDTGIGIDKEDQMKLMKPFVQLSRLCGTNAANNGTGLGLAISKRLVEKMNGTISLESQVGKGSTFGVLLHHVFCPAPEAAALEKTGNPSAESAPGTWKNRMPHSILVVDDVPMNLKVMKALCRNAGIQEIRTASSGEAALTMLRKKSPDVILTDLWMPGMNGAELADAIRMHKEWDGIPVIAVTADVEIKDNFPLSRFSGTLLKPVTIEKIQAAVNAVMHASEE